MNIPIDGDKNTLLHLAADQGQTEMVRCLVNRGAHLKQRNAAGLKAEGVARQAGFEATADEIAVWGCKQICVNGLTMIGQWPIISL